MTKIEQWVYIKDLPDKVDIADCNLFNILMKAGAQADMREIEDDEKADLRRYQRLSGEPMYLL